MPKNYFSNQLAFAYNGWFGGFVKFLTSTPIGFDEYLIGRPIDADLSKIGPRGGFDFIDRFGKVGFRCKSGALSEPVCYGFAWSSERHFELAGEHGAGLTNLKRFTVRWIRR